MRNKAPIKIGLPPGKRALWIERYSKEYEEQTKQLEFSDRTIQYRERVAVNKGYWLIPLATNPDRTLGDFLRLYDNGKIERITLRPDDNDSVVLIKPEDR